MGATTTKLCNIHGFLLLLISSGSWLLHPTQAFKLHGGGYGEEEKVPLSFIVPDPLPGLSPLAAPPPVTGDDGMRPRLPTERWRRGRSEERRSRADERRSAAHAPALAPSSSSLGPAPSSAEAPPPDSGTGSIESSPAVPVPRGVTDTATVLPMPVPGVKRQDMGGAAALAGASMVAGLIAMMATLGALLC